jgi:predicted metalloprotease with PDZ domain
MSMNLLRNLRAPIALVLTTMALLCCAHSAVAGQQLNVLIRVLPDSSRVAVEGSCLPASVWSFRDSYAGMLGLGNRIERLTLLDEGGNEVSTHKLAPGQFQSARPATHFQYEVSLTPPVRAADSPMMSWLSKEHGLLNLADLLPLSSSHDDQTRRAMVRFKLPDQWTVHSDETENPQGGFEVVADRCVFAVGTHLRTSRITESGMMFDLVVDGDWAFADREALEMAGKVLKAHREVFGAMPARKGTLILFPFPQAVAATQWSAETKGSTVTLLMGKLPSRIGALAQLSTPLTHELFHLWVPNGLALDGDYDWFYEGFTIYQAARTAVRLDLLTFPEFLNSIARAYDASKTQTDPLSLIEASKRRFTVGQTSVYSKGQVIAFIYDLRLLSVSHGKRSLNDAYRKLFQAQASMATDVRSPRLSDGNDAAMNALTAASGSEDFVRNFIRSPVSINLPTELAPFGLKVETLGLRTHISINEKLSKQQRDLLRQLGYNDATHGPRSR